MGLGVSLDRRRLIPTLPGIRSLPNTTSELEEQAEFQEWRLKWGGSFPEFLVFRELERRGLKVHVAFQFQASQFGGRQKLGGAVVDFILQETIAGRGQGEFFHFRNTESKVANLLQRRLLEQAGFTVVDMLALEIQASPNRIVRLFIQGIETPNAQIKGRLT